MKNNIHMIKSFTNRFVLLLLLSSCNRNKNASNASPQHIHTIEIIRTGIGKMYLDKVPGSCIMQHDSQDAALQHFFSIKIGMEEVGQNAMQKESKERKIYYQYGMDHDWVGVLGGDSIRPVFYQPMEQRTANLHEGVLVFDMPEGKTPDTLIYNDALGMWGKQLIILH